MHTDPGAATALPERLVRVEEARLAADRIAGVARATPLIPAGGRLSLKAECFQATGSFKFRGAYNALRAAAEQGEVKGVVAYSSGNHARAAARSARLLGVRATVVMPETAAPIKLRNAAAEGAAVVRVGPGSDERAEVARRIALSRGELLLPSTEHPDVIAGQATIGIELLESWGRLRQRSPSLDDRGGGLAVAVPVGGGGLASGVGLAVKSLLPAARVIGVEPATAADARESLELGRIVRWSSDIVSGTIADGVRDTSLGPLAFRHLRTFVDRIVTVEEADIERAARWLASEAGMVVEPTGALAVAACLPGTDLDFEHAVCVVSGGNIDPARHRQLLGGVPHP